jgi:archaellum biogenesis protein FlaJ (TadC family)
MSAANFKTNKDRKLGKYLLIAAVIGAIVIIILISTGIVTWKDLIQMHFKQIEICPFCM